MNLAASLIADSEVVDGLESVTVHDVSGNVTCTGVSALSSGLSYRELAADGGAGYERE